MNYVPILPHLADTYQMPGALVFTPGRGRRPVEAAKMVDLILMLKGAMATEGKVGLMMNVSKDQQGGVLALMPGHTPTISGLSDPGWVDVVVILSEGEVRGLSPSLKRAGATSVVEFPLNKIID